MKMHSRDIAYDAYRLSEEFDPDAVAALHRAFRGVPGWSGDPDLSMLCQGLDEAWFAAFCEADKIDLDGLSDADAYRALYRVALPAANWWNLMGDCPVVRRVAARAVARDLINDRAGHYVKGVASSRFIISAPDGTFGTGERSAHILAGRVEEAARAAHI